MKGSRCLMINYYYSQGKYPEEINKYRKIIAILKKSIKLYVYELQIPFMKSKIKSIDDEHDEYLIETASRDQTQSFICI